MKASEDCKARIEEQLNSISSLRKSLFDEIAAHLENLESKSKQWEGFQEQLDKFVEYMDTVDSRLERSRRESRVSQEWLAQVKVRAPGKCICDVWRYTFISVNGNLYKMTPPPKRKT